MHKVSTGRLRLALALAVCALAAALVGAIGPAKHERTVYTWPPAGMPTGTPSRAWYTPLLLIRKEPESISARIPCVVPRALPDAARPLTLLATARSPERYGGLLVARRADELLVRIGKRALGRMSIPQRAARDPKCTYRLELGHGRWSIEGPGANEQAADLAAMPQVSGLFSAVDLRIGTPLSIEVTTTVHGSRATARQTVAWIAAMLCALAALLLVALERRPRRPLTAVGSALRAAARHAHGADAAIGGLILVWWLIAPTFWDDGWVSARVRNFSASGGFSVYYNAFAGNLPLGYWPEWLQYWFAELSATLLVQRVPAVLCLAAIWVICRWALTQIMASLGSEQVSVWILASGFAAIALAWDMTLRPEPKVALVVSGVFACTIRFLERPRAGPLAVAAMLIPLAVSAHPTGILALAPLLVTAPALVRWARHRLTVAGTLGVGSAALFVALFSVGSDLGLRANEARVQRAHGDGTAVWYHEIVRYWHVGTPLQRTAVALMLLALLSFLLRRRGDKRILLNLPSATIGVALILLLATPSKLPCHFGVLLGVAAVAIATESARLRQRAKTAAQMWALLVVVIGAAALAAAWSWLSPNGWEQLDLRTLDWDLEFEGAPFPLMYLALFAPIVLLVGASVLELRRTRDNPTEGTAWRVSDWTAPALALPAVVVMAVVLVADTATTRSWTLARQNLSTLVGEEGCGLADDAYVARLRSVEPVAPARIGSPNPPFAPVRKPPVPGLDRFTLRPLGRKPVHTPWFVLDPASRVGVFVGGTPGPRDRLELEWGRRRAKRIETLGIDPIAAAPIVADLRSGTRYVEPTWRFLSSGELPPPPPDATAVRIGYRSTLAPRAALAVTAPVTYENERLVDRFRRNGSTSLVLPNMLMYFPCVRQPRLEDGIVEVPSQMVAYRSPWPVGVGTSPFDGLLDLYRVNRLSLTDSRDPLEAAVVYEFELRILGVRRAAPVAVTTTS